VVPQSSKKIDECLMKRIRQAWFIAKRKRRVSNNFCHGPILRNDPIKTAFERGNVFPRPARFRRPYVMLKA
jgi:hypothetical protein